MPEIEKVPMEKFTESNQYRAEFYNEYVGGKNAKEDSTYDFWFYIYQKAIKIATRNRFYRMYDKIKKSIRVIKKA